MCDRKCSRRNAWKATVAGWLAVCLAAGSHGVATAQVGTSADRIREMERSVVRIIVRVPGGTSTGTGSVVAPGFVLTNQHVVDGGTRFWVASAHTGGRQIPARVRWESPDLDLAVLRVDGLSLPTVTLGTMVLRGPDEVWALGYPGGSDLVSEELTLDLTWSKGVISRVFTGRWQPRGRRDLEQIQHTAPINRGNSGGPLVSDCGFVVGVNTQGFDRDAQGRDLHNIFLASRITEAVRELRRLSVPVEVAGTRCSSTEAGAGAAEASSEAEAAARRAEEALAAAGHAEATAAAAAAAADEAKNQSQSAMEKLGQVYWLMLALALIVLPALLVLAFRRPRERVVRVVEQASVKVRNWRTSREAVGVGRPRRHSGRGPHRSVGGNGATALRLMPAGNSAGSHGEVIVIAGPGMELSGGGFVLGSHPALADKVLHHPTVSRRHARIVRDGRRFLVEDLNSSNGTQVNGAELAPFTLREISPGCTIRFGAMPVLGVQAPSLIR